MRKLGYKSYIVLGQSRPRPRMESSGQDSVWEGTFLGHSKHFFVTDAEFPTDLLDIICTRQSGSLSFELKASLLVIKQKIE